MREITNRLDEMLLRVELCERRLEATHELIMAVKNMVDGFVSIMKEEL